MDSIALKENLNRSRATQDHERITRLKSTQNQLKPKITNIFKHLDEIIKLENDTEKTIIDNNLKNLYLAILQYKTNKEDLKINIAEDEDLQAFDRWMDDLIHQGSTISDNKVIKEISLKASRFISTETSDNCVTNPVTEEAPENIENNSKPIRITRKILDAIFNDDKGDNIDLPYTVEEFTGEIRDLRHGAEKVKQNCLDNLNVRGLELPEKDEARILPMIISIMTGDQKELHKKFKAFYNLSSEPGEEQNQAYLELIRYVNAEKVHDYEEFKGLFIKVFQPIVSRLISKEKYEDSIKS
jgi:hypothetical protein